MPICVFVHASRPAAAAGLSVTPSGNVIVAVLSCDESIAAGLRVRQTQFGRDAVRQIGLRRFWRQRERRSERNR